MKRRHAYLLVAWVVLLLLVPFAGGVRADEEDPEAALAEAWHLLEVERKPEEAARRYEALSRTGHSSSVRARALLGLARTARLLGDIEASQRYLDEAFRLSPELDAVREAMANTRPAEERTRFVTGWVRLSAGQGLDLDSGGVYPGPRTFSGGRVELYDAGGGLTRPEGAEEDATLARRVAVPGPRPWLRLVTDEGRLAWFQVLVPGPEPVLRFVTRVSGTRTVLPEVRGAFCLGRERQGGEGGGIEVHFKPSPAFASYRIEAQRNAEGPFQPLGEVAEPPFLHADADTNVRYAYRITGLDGVGNAGLPTRLIGSTQSAGVVSGTLVMRRGQAFDLLTGREAADGGDLELVNTYGGNSGAGFVDAGGRRVRELSFDQTMPRALWEGIHPHTFPYVKDGGVFVVPLRGGGIARCRLEMVTRSRDRSAPEARVHYETHPDGIVFPPPPVLLADRAVDGVQIRATGLLESQSVPHVVAHDVLGDRPPRTVTRKTATGVFLDDVVGPQDQSVFRYEATPEDRHGRRGVSGSAVFDGRPSGVRTGTFQLHYEQGWSFLGGAVVPAAEADVVFASCAGGISSIMLAAAGGITNLEHSLHPPLHEDRQAGDPEILAASVIGLDPERVRLGGRASGDSRLPASDVFVLRLRHGGWARVAIVARAEHADGGWTKQRATFRYAWNPKAPRFDEDVPPDEVDARDDGFVVLPPERALERRRQAFLGHHPPAPTPGTFAFHYRQGFDFEEGRVVENVADADVFFETCAGGISSITLKAPGGIVNLPTLYPAGVEGEREALLDAILAIEDDQTVWVRARPARGDSRTPASDVFLLRTRHGGWVKMAILERGDEGGWTDHLAQVRYVFSPHAPKFVEDVASGVVRSPLRVHAGAANAFPVDESPASPSGPSGRPKRRWAPPPPEAWLRQDDDPPPPPAPWLAPYRTERATAESYDRLRVDLLRSPDDAFVVSGLVYLAGAHDPHYRRLAAGSLPGAYVLGAQGGVGAAGALRKLAQDPDPWTRYYALCMGKVLDTPLRRELLLRHLDAPVPMPDGEGWAPVRDMIGSYVERYSEQVGLPAVLAEADEAARARWIAAAPARPATADAGRFEVVDLTAGKPYRYVLERGDAAMGIPDRFVTLRATGFHVAQSDDGPASGDAATLHVEGERGGRTSVGSAKPFATSKGGMGGRLHEDLTRVVGEGRLRVWRRAAEE